jgi:hypothetical protein
MRGRQDSNDRDQAVGADSAMAETRTRVFWIQLKGYPPWPAREWPENECPDDVKAKRPDEKEPRAALFKFFNEDKYVWCDPSSATCFGDGPEHAAIIGKLESRRQKSQELLIAIEQAEAFLAEEAQRAAAARKRSRTPTQRLVESSIVSPLTAKRPKSSFDLDLFAPGCAVEALFESEEKGQKKWYAGTVVECVARNETHECTVAFEDGDKQTFTLPKELNDLRPKRVAKTEAAPSTAGWARWKQYTLSSEVEAEFESSDEGGSKYWLEGVVVKIADTKISVLFNDGETLEYMYPKDQRELRMRSKAPARPPKPAQTVQVAQSLKVVTQTTRGSTSGCVRTGHSVVMKATATRPALVCRTVRLVAKRLMLEIGSNSAIKFNVRSRAIISGCSGRSQKSIILTRRI